MWLEFKFLSERTQLQFDIDGNWVYIFDQSPAD